MTCFRATLSKFVLRFIMMLQWRVAGRLPAIFIGWPQRSARGAKIVYPRISRIGANGCCKVARGAHAKIREGACAPRIYFRFHNFRFPLLPSSFVFLHRTG